MVADLSLLAFPAAASPVVLPPPKDLHAALPFQGKRPQDAAAMQLEGQAVQMVVPAHAHAHAHAHAQAAAFQAFAVPDKATLIDIQDSCPDSVRLSLGIEEQCARQEKILKFLMSGSDVKELDGSLLAELTEHQPLAVNMGSQPYMPDDKLSICEFGLDEPQQYMPEKQLFIPNPVLEFIQFHGSVLTVDQTRRILFTANFDEMRDLLAVFLHFNMSKRETGGCKSAFLVPYFDSGHGIERESVGEGKSPFMTGSRERGSLCIALRHLPANNELKRHARANSKVSNSKLASMAIETSKSTDVKLKSSSKKKQKGKHIKERDLYQNNYFHASEAFLSILLDKDRTSSTILSLKKAGPEISELLTQCSIGIAGTGLAILLSVMCKIAIGIRTPFASTRLLSTSVGFGLFWLSWAVNGLRDTITSIFRSPSNMNINEEEVAVKIQKSMNEIVFRAMTLLAIAALKFA
ncbi:hypothetical protein ACP4OV_016470 [Aristida adscensionis]